MQSDTIANLIGALAKAQGDFKPIVKGTTVEVKMKSGGVYSYSYAPLEDILSSCRPALSANGLAIIQTLDEGDDGSILETMLAHESGEWVKSFKKLGQTGNPQEFGGRLTYFRRYQISAILGVSSEDDDDANSASGKDATKKQQSQKPTTTKPANPKKSPAKTNGMTAVKMLEIINAETDNHYKDVNHLQNGIRKALGDDKWGWPAPDNTEKWQEAQAVAIEYGNAPSGDQEDGLPK